MNEKTINEQYAYIYSLLEDRRLKEALIQLESLLWQCSDWDLRTRLEQLQTSYKYMLDYMESVSENAYGYVGYRRPIAVAHARQRFIQLLSQSAPHSYITGLSELRH